MAAEKCIGEGTELTPIGDWSASLKGLHAQIAHRFPRSEVRERVRRYLSGLLGRVERKNGWGSLPRLSVMRDYKASKGC